MARQLTAIDLSRTRFQIIDGPSTRLKGQV